jgi:hypothetical protein
MIEQHGPEARKGDLGHGLADLGHDLAERGGLVFDRRDRRGATPWRDVLYYRGG